MTDSSRAIWRIAKTQRRLELYERLVRHSGQDSLSRAIDEAVRLYVDCKEGRYTLVQGQVRIGTDK